MRCTTTLALHICGASTLTFQLNTTLVQDACLKRARTLGSWTTDGKIIF